MDIGDEPIPESRCLHCGEHLNGVSPLDGSASRANAGDPIMCIECGAAMTIGEDRKLRPFTQAEIDELLRDERLMGELRRWVGRIRWLRAGVN